jgi:hypothetical protein
MSQEENQISEHNSDIDISDEDVEPIASSSNEKELKPISGSTNPKKLTDEEKRKIRSERERERRRRKKKEQEEMAERLKELENKGKRGRRPKSITDSSSKPKPVKPTNSKPDVSVEDPQEKRKENRMINKNLDMLQKRDDIFVQEFAKTAAFMKVSLDKYKKKKRKQKQFNDTLDRKFREFAKVLIEGQKKLDDENTLTKDTKENKKKKVEINDAVDNDMDVEEQYLKKKQNNIKPVKKWKRPVHPFVKSQFY